LERKQTRFAFVYENLRRQILSGQREYGSKLPSARQLCQLYGVGIRTIKTVLMRLREEGLIHTEERKRAVVVYRVPFREQKHTALQTIAGQRDAILEIYRSMEALMPDLLTFSCQFTDIINLDHYDDILRWARRPNLTSNGWKIPARFFHDILKSSGNPFFCDVHSALELHGETSFLTEYLTETGLFPQEKEKEEFNRILDAVRSGNTYAIQNSFRAHYHSIANSVACCMQHLDVQYPQEPMDPRRYFSWNTSYGIHQHYQRIARNLAERINFGTYAYRSYLPSERALAEEYGVSVHTVRRALSILNNLGFVKTQNGRGTQVLTLDLSASIKNTNHSRLLLHLNALQFMALIVRPIALSAFDGTRQSLQKAFSQPQGISLADLTSHVVDNVPLYPLKVILQKIDYIFYGGIYLYRRNSPFPDAPNELAVRIFSCLEKDDRQGFAHLLFETYCGILTNLRNLLVDNGVPEAERVITPNLW